MARFHGDGEQVHLPIPEWLKEEPDEKRQNAMIAYIFMWNLFGFQNKENRSLKDYFTLDIDGWTEEDTEYIIKRLTEEGIIKIRE